MIAFDGGSFRDRAGRVFSEGSGVFRAVRRDALESWRSLSQKSFYRELESEGKLPRTTEPAREVPAGWDGVLEHERVPVVSYPYEWSFEMLRRAALLQLEIVDRAVRDGAILRDATPFNIQWIGARPLFIDILSFTALGEGQLWNGYRQFCELFLYPLLLEVHRGIAFQPLLRGRIDGIEAATASRLLMPSKVLKPGILKHVYLHSLLQRSMQAQTSGSVAENVRAQHVAGGDLIRSNVKNLSRIVEKLSPRRSRSSWTGYEVSHTYTSDERVAKEQFVRETVRQLAPAITFDIGCNTGAFSEIAAEHSAIVVAADFDPAVVDAVFARGRPNILPLVWDFADPSPGIGWRGRERSPLVERLQPDLILALALIHHLVIGRNIPLPEVIEELAAFGSAIVIEWVERNDPMVARLLEQKDERFDDYAKPGFEHALEQHFVIDRKLELTSGSRTLYAARPRFPRGTPKS